MSLKLLSYSKTHYQEGLSQHGDLCNFGPPAQNRDLCIEGYQSIPKWTDSKFISINRIDVNIKESEGLWRGAFEANIMAKHQLKFSPSLHGVVKWLTLLAAAKHSSWLWFAGSDRTYQWLTPSQSPELWTPFWMASWWEKQGKRNIKTSIRHTSDSFVVYLQIIDSFSAFACHSFYYPSFWEQEEDQWFSTNTGVGGLQIKPGA